MLIKTLRTDKGYVVVLINKNKVAQTVTLVLPGVKPVALLNRVSDPQLTNEFTMLPEETKVVEFR